MLSINLCISCLSIPVFLEDSLGLTLESHWYKISLLLGPQELQRGEVSGKEATGMQGFSLRFIFFFFSKSGSYEFSIICEMRVSGECFCVTSCLATPTFLNFAVSSSNISKVLLSLLPSSQACPLPPPQILTSSGSF